jgi:hypothetical protein
VWRGHRITARNWWNPLLFGGEELLIDEVCLILIDGEPVGGDINKEFVS